MFELGKVVGWLLSPLTLALTCWTLGLSLAWGRRLKLGLVFCAFGAIWLWAISTPLVANALVRRLERQYPAVLAEQLPEADAIVVLGGALSGASPPDRPTFDFGSAADRVWFTAALYRAGKAPWVLVSGGNQPGDAGMQVEAEAIRSVLIRLGVPDSAIRVEGLSRNTSENANESLKLIRAIGAKRVLLVTSAMHMSRALRSFQIALRDSGIAVLPASTDVEGLPDSLHPLGRWLPDANSLTLSSRAIREYEGLFALFVKDML